MDKSSMAFHSSGLLPQEEKLAVKTSKSSLVIGVPREHSFQENRVALCPESIQLIVENGHRVIVERGAGHLAGFRDDEFADAGAEIAEDSKPVFEASLILKVAPPTLPELSLMGNAKTLISALHPTAQTVEYYKTLMQKKITAFAFEMIRDNTGMFPVLHSMSEIAGYTAMQISAEYLSRSDFGRGVILGSVTGITPTEVVIIGAGTVGEYAARAALGLGATVKIFDNKLYKLKALQDKLGARLFTSIIHPKVLQKALKTTDVLITALHSHYGRTPVVVSEEMVLSMKQGSIIVDASIDQGGCVATSMATTHNNPVFQFNGVTHYCVPNMPSRIPRTASFALSNFFTPVLIDIGERGSIEKYLVSDQGFRKGAYTFNGILTNRVIGDNFKLPSQDIELMMAAFLR
jgi:alanine dehydrogenase